MESSNQNKREIVKKGGLNAKTGLILFFINTMTAFILNPLLVAYFGTYYFGIWKSIEKFLGFAAIADGKGAQALKWTIANQESSDNILQKRRYVGSAVIVWFIFLPILVTIIGLVAYFSPTLISNVKPEDGALVMGIITLLGINLIITPLLNISESVLVGTNRGYLGNYIRMVWLLIAFFITYLIIFFEYELKDLAMSIVVVTLLRGVTYFVVVRKEVSWFSALKPKREELSSFFKFSSWKLAWSFVARFLMASEIIFLSTLIGPEVVSHYIFTAYLVITGVSVAAIVTSSFNPGIGRLFGNQEFKACQHIIGNLREFILAFALFVGTTILLLNQSFVTLWAGEGLFLGSVNNLLIVLIMIELLMIRNEAFLLDISLSIRTKVLMGIASITLSSVLAVVGYSLGNSISAILIGIFLGRLLILFAFPLMVNRMVKRERGFGFSFKLFSYVVTILAMGYYVGYIQLFTSWWSLILFGGLEVLFLMVLIYTLLLREENRAVIRQKFLKRFYKKEKLQSSL
jgi:O-antigen/teichoic acid export membrane protein